MELEFKVIPHDSVYLGDGMLPGYMTGLTQQTWVHPLYLCTSASHMVSLHTGHTKEITLAHIVAKWLHAIHNIRFLYSVTHMELHCTSSLALGASNMSSYWRGCTDIRRRNATQANSPMNHSSLCMHLLNEINLVVWRYTHIPLLGEMRALAVPISSPQVTRWVVSSVISTVVPGESHDRVGHFYLGGILFIRLRHQ